jgi:UDP-3-O-[3-hydroxymyristoyl] glucosamine N-acyltransferase
MISISDLAAGLGAEFQGDGSILVSGAAEPDTATVDQIALGMEPAFAEALGRTAARAALVWAGADWRGLGLGAAIFAPKGRRVMAGVTRVFDRPPELAAGIHPGAVIDQAAEIAKDVSIGAFAVIGARARIGRGARILSHVVVAEDAVIGSDALIHAGARIGARVVIGDRFIAQPGAVIGSDGFSYVAPVPGAIEEAKEQGAVTTTDSSSYLRINSLGTVVIGDDVEIGANSCIDRGTISLTRIGNGTKIDNLVQIGHNVQIGENCLICGQAGVAGSTLIGDGVVIGGAASVADHLRIGSHVVITGKSGVSGHVADNRIMMGNPAVDMDRNIEMYKALRRLPRVLARLGGGQKPVSKAGSSD